jgi:hypothetical protein
MEGSGVALLFWLRREVDDGAGLAARDVEARFLVADKRSSGGAFDTGEGVAEARLDVDKEAP